MTVIETINRIDALKPNAFPLGEKVKWLSALDGIIYKKIMETHEGADSVIFTEYDESTDLGTVLLVPAPYDEIYLFWLESRIDYWNGELRRYNNSVQMYNAAYTEYERFYNRTHKPKGTRLKFRETPKTPELQVANGVAKVTIEED